MARESYAAEARAAALALSPGPRTARLERAYEMFGLLGPGDLTSVSLAERRLAHLTAFYSIETGRITVLVADPAQPITSDALHFALAHEYAHALQDQRYDLESFFLARQSSYDEILGARSVCEGDAQIRAALALRGDADAARIAQTAFTELVADAERDPAAEIAPLLEIPYHFAYDHGARYVDGRRRLGAPAVDELFVAPPAGSGPIFYEVELGEPPLPATTAALPGAVPPAGVTELAHESLGAAALHGFVAKMSGDLGLARTLALDWSQDDFWIWETAGASAALWRIRWGGGRELCPALRARGWTASARSGACRDVGATTILVASDDVVATADLLMALVPSEGLK